MSNGRLASGFTSYEDPTRYPYTSAVQQVRNQMHNLRSPQYKIYGDGHSQSDLIREVQDTQADNMRFAIGHVVSDARHEEEQFGAAYPHPIQGMFGAPAAFTSVSIDVPTIADYSNARHLLRTSVTNDEITYRGAPAEVVHEAPTASYMRHLGEAVSRRPAIYDGHPIHPGADRIDPEMRAVLAARHRRMADQTAAAVAPAHIKRELVPTGFKVRAR